MILDRQKKVRINRRPLESFLQKVRGELGLGRAEIAICFVSDAEMSRMNKAFRKKKGTTDVLSFPASERKRAVAIRSRQRAAIGGEQLGDVAISPVVARRNAKEYGRKLEDEIRILILHGVLHLLGYDHETDRGQMDRLERKLRKRLKLEDASESARQRTHGRRGVRSRQGGQALPRTGGQA